MQPARYSDNLAHTNFGRHGLHPLSGTAPYCDEHCVVVDDDDGLGVKCAEIECVNRFDYMLSDECFFSRSIKWVRESLSKYFGNRAPSSCDLKRTEANCIDC